MKRYSIVRVDGKCPYHTTDKAFCIHQQEKRFCLECKIRDRYGDTKEQMIRKVATAILRTLKDGEVLKYEEFGTGFIKQPVSVEYLAKKIVEFLGVKE